MNLAKDFELVLFLLFSLFLFLVFTMFTIIRASYSLMPHVCEIINSNLPAYQELINGSNNYLDYYVDDDWAQANFKHREFYLARVDAIYVGMVSFQQLDHFGYIGYFHIHKDHQRKGYGSQLLKFIELRLKSEKLSILRLFTHQKAIWAQKFYQKHDFHLLSSDFQTIRKLDHGVLKPYHAVNHILWEKQFESSEIAEKSS